MFASGNRSCRSTTSVLPPRNAAGTQVDRGLSPLRTLPAETTASPLSGRSTPGRLWRAARRRFFGPRRWLRILFRFEPCFLLDVLKVMGEGAEAGFPEVAHVFEPG